MKDLYQIDWDDCGYFLQDDAIKLDGLDSAVLGITDTGHLCYSYELIVDTFVTRDEMQYDEAIEWVEYNIVPLHMYGGFSLVYTDI